jgi:glutamyl-tRNA synthetase
MKVVTRFAPSPTGMLHIGSARSALFNMYFAKRHSGKCLLRIEDTDRERSTPEAVDAIINGFRWLGVDFDGETFFQFKRAARHAEIAHEMVKKGTAYFCYMTADEIQKEREAAEANGTMWHYDRRWRDSTQTPPAGVKPSIRIKAPLGDGALTLKDEVQGDVTVKYSQLDDFILLRSDGTPTYMLAVVVDDHDMDVTHVIRGDDHLNNMFRQNLIYQGMDWTFPIHAHIPLIHGTDGKKLSKRKGAAAVEDYRDMGYLPEAMRNYLLRLGWSHGDNEIISDAQAIEWFDLEHIGQSPAQLDFDKLNHVNHHYIKLKDNKGLYVLLQPFLAKKFGILPPDAAERIQRGMTGLKERSKTLIEMADTAGIYIQPKVLDDAAKEKLAQLHTPQVIAAAIDIAHGINDWDGKAVIDAILAKTGLKMGQVGPVLRIALTGTLQSPDMTEVITALGRDEVRKRLQEHA